MLLDILPLSAVPNTTKIFTSNLMVPNGSEYSIIIIQLIHSLLLKILGQQEFIKMQIDGLMFMEH
jgi:hypothetical protein